jgi:hypothetical protein
MMAEMFENEMLKFAYNKHATHVLIKFIKSVDVHPYLNNIYDLIVKNMDGLSQDPNGLPVIKNTIQKFYLPEIKHKMIEALSWNVVVLS